MVSLRSILKKNDFRHLFFCAIFPFCLQAQEVNALDFKTYLSFVKKHHPVAKQAELTISVAEANLLKSIRIF